MKMFLIFTLLSISIISLVTFAMAQDTVQPLLAVSSNHLTLYAKENGAPVTTDFTVVGLAAWEGVEVTIVPSTLYDNSTENFVMVKINDEENLKFTLTQNVDKKIEITLDPSDKKIGTYEGVLIITATNNTTTEDALTTNIKVTAKIDGVGFWYKSEYVQAVFVIGAILPMFFGLLWPDRADAKYSSKRFWIVVFGAISVSFWLVSFISLSFAEPATIINTVVVTPFLTYVVNFVKDKRTERLEKEKDSRKIRSSGIEKDIDLLRSVMGEISTHCASFNPHLFKQAESVKNTNPKTKQTTEFDYFHKILFTKSGVLKREIWNKSCKQGIITDLPLLELEKYYDFLDIYNRYYSCALSLIKNKKPSMIHISVFDFKTFDKFRKAYSKLETVIFVYLSYILGHLSKTHLSPLQVEYRRITRTLLKNLVDYEILNPAEFKEQIKILEECYNDKTEYYQSLFKEKHIEYDKFRNKPIEEWPLDTKFKFIIDIWHLDADDIELIHSKIYSRKNIPKAYRRIANDFKEKYIALKESVTKLPPISDKPEESEKKNIEISGKLALLKNDQVVDTLEKMEKSAADKIQGSANDAVNSVIKIIENKIEDSIKFADEAKGYAKKAENSAKKAEEHAERAGAAANNKG